MPENNPQQKLPTTPQAKNNDNEPISIGRMFGGAPRALKDVVSQTASGASGAIKSVPTIARNSLQNYQNPPAQPASKPTEQQIQVEPQTAIAPPQPQDLEEQGIVSETQPKKPPKIEQVQDTESAKSPSSESSKETGDYLFKYVSPEGEPYAALTGPAEDIYTRLTKNEDAWNRFAGNVQAVDDVQRIFDKLSDPNLPPNEKDALYIQLRSKDPRLFQALTWAAAVKQNPDEAIKNPEESIEHSRTLFEFGALRYASKGGRLTNRLNELQYQYVHAKGEQKEAIAQEINAIKDMMAQRYASLYSKALGDQELTPEDLDLVYYNFAQETGLKDMKTDPEYVRQGIQEWFMDPNVGPLPKMGVLLGVPATIIGILQMLTQGYSTGALLLTLLGGAGMMFGGQQWLSSKKQVSPGAPIIRGELASPYLENSESESM